MKRTIAFTLVLLTALGACLGLRVRAAGDVTFTVVNDLFVPTMSDANMPLRRNGQTYLPYTMLTWLITVKVYYNKEYQRLLVYDTDRMLTMTFDLAAGIAYDDAGTELKPNAIRYNGTIYVPVSVICQVFGFTSSYITSSPLGNVVRISTEEVTVPDGVLVVRAAERMKQIYQDYLATKQPGQEPGTPADPDPKPTDDPQKTPKLVYLAFEGPLNDATDRMLDILAAHGATASFFIGASDAQREDTLRRMFAEGHTVGILAPQDKTMTEDAMRGAISDTSDALRDILHTRPHLLCVPGSAGLSMAARDVLVADGYRIWEKNVDPRADDRTAAGIRLNVEYLLKKMTRSAVVRLTSNDTVAEALPGILDYLHGEGSSVIAIREWDTPINGAREVR